MDYSRSLANITAIKDHIRLFKETVCIFFDFNHLMNFKIIFVNDAIDLPKLRNTKYKQELPFATMYINSSGQEILIYEDDSLSFYYNLTCDCITLCDIKPDFSKPENRKKLIGQFASLTNRIKK